MHRIISPRASLARRLPSPLLLAFLCLITGGCPSHQTEEEKPLLGRNLTTRVDMQPNVGETVRIVGTARYLKVGGPSVAADDFEVRVYPTDAWGPEMDGKRVEINGRLESSTHALPPDPSVKPGEYWLADSKWRPATAATKP